MLWDVADAFRAVPAREPVAAEAALRLGQTFARLARPDLAHAAGVCSRGVARHVAARAVPGAVVRRGRAGTTSGQLAAARGQRPFIVVAPVQTDKTRESIVEVSKEVRDIAGARPIAGEEFASIMRTQTLGLPGRIATLAALEGTAAQMLNYGYADDYYDTYARRVRTLGEGDLDQAARKFVRPDEVIWIVAGDPAHVEAGIRELNLGEVVRLDADGRPLTAAESR